MIPLKFPGPGRGPSIAFCISSHQQTSHIRQQKAKQSGSIISGIKAQREDTLALVHAVLTLSPRHLPLFLCYSCPEPAVLNTFLRVDLSQILVKSSPDKKNGVNMISQTSDSQSAVPRWATSALTGSWLEAQITNPSPGQLNQKLWGWDPAVCGLWSLRADSDAP